MKRKLLLAAVLLVPLGYLLYRLFATGVADPIKFIYTVTGGSALVLLYITTSISMLRKLHNFVRYRRMIGLFSFFYALLHMLNFVILDMELDIPKAVAETLDKPFVYLGMTAFLILLFMAITSLRILFARFFKYHKVIYLAITLATIHFAMAQKALSLEQWGYLGVMGIIALLKLLQRTRLLNL